MLLGLPILLWLEIGRGGYGETRSWRSARRGNSDDDNVVTRTVAPLLQADPTTPSTPTSAVRWPSSSATCARRPTA